MQLPPPSVLKAFPEPNYVNPHTRGPGVLIVNIVMLCLAFVVTCLRLYTRLKITTSPGLDDALIIFAMGFAIAMCTVNSLAAERHGWSRHIWDIPPTWLPTLQKYNLTFQVLFSWASTLTKLSLLWFCRRLLGTGSKGGYRLYNWCYIGGLAFVALCCILFTFIDIFQCSPVKAYWEVNPKYPHSCMNGGAIVFAASVVNIFTDFLATVLPMPLIWSLKLPTRQRLAVISIFGLGILVNVAGTCRTVYVYKSMLDSYDQTWMGWPVLVSAAVEINIGLICASAPALRPLIAFFLPRLLQSTQKYGRSNNRKSLSKLRSSTGPSKHSQYVTDSRSHGKDPLDRFEVLRTVELETWSESRIPGQDTGHAYDVTSQHNRLGSSDGSLEQNNDRMVYTAPGSSKSSDTIIHGITTDSPFTDKHPV
ncbi:integral membrane protein [Aspergillus sclerotialis]|uniref:Integral membrane protein n=1 Tax=Aspergillus sclerotialis TaxID=2070753 RepID=A0A3A2ZX85_9EURO|nr:integral membrane protein [Aspergillus sclerotialis]